MNITVLSRTGRDYGSVQVSSGNTVSDLKRAVYEQLFKPNKMGHLVPNRHRYTLSNEKGAAALKDDKQQLSSVSFDLKNPVVYFKDLGMQISYKLVFVVEYTGPILLWLALALSTSLNQIQYIATVLWVLHFVKRVLETLFVHRFSHATMPVWPNLFKNCTHYWGAGMYVGFFVITMPSITVVNELQLWTGIVIFCIGEYINGHAHITLKNLRKPGTTTRSIPRGFMFEYVTCANYFGEIMTWFGFLIVTIHPSVLFFLVLSAGQMYIWAKQKHNKLIAMFPDYPKHRKILIPFVI
mmetsp:Transcript_1253/g.1420  ORF Transcript_1253/g.1420 Transcript_1253/m.1420 type:complete len:296 (+) Transcript_1253:54-941(+)